MQDQLFDPYALEREQDAARRSHRITPQVAEQMVLDMVTRAGGEVRGDRLLRLAHDAGLDTDSVSHAVHVLQRAHRIATDGNVISLVAAA